MERLIASGKVVTVSAGNQASNTADHAFSSLGPGRGVSRTSASTGIDKALLVVGGTALPSQDVFNTLFEILDFSGQIERHDGDVATGEHVRIAAPSSQVPVLDNDFETVKLSGGTSFSAPYVAGLAAEMFAVDPTATNVEIVDIIERTADDLDIVGPDESVGFGRINCWKAILTLLNRNRPDDDPAWLGIRFRFTPGAPETLTLTLDDQPIPDIVVRRVPDITKDVGGNAGEVPSEDALPASFAAQFSIQPSDLKSGADGISVFKVAGDGGERVYEIPMRLSDLLHELPIDSSLDDYVLTLDIHNESAAIYGQVTSDGAPVAGATIQYTDLSGNGASVTTDAFGYYAIYDALPNEPFEISASEGNQIGDAYDITVTGFTAERQDFVLSEPAWPRTYVGTGTRTLTVEWDFNGGGGATSVQRIDVEVILRENGDVDCSMSTPDGEVVEVPIIGAPGQTATQINNVQWVETTCPADATANAGQTVTVIQYSFGKVGWGGTWQSDNTYEMKFQSVMYDMFINGNFSKGSLSGSGSWPDATLYPRGAEFSNFICSRYESVTFSRLEWDFTAQLVVDVVP